MINSVINNDNPTCQTLDNTWAKEVAKEKFLQVFDQEMLNTTISALTAEVQSKLKYNTDDVTLQELMLDLRSIHNIKKYLQKLINSSVTNKE